MHGIYIYIYIGTYTSVVYISFLFLVCIYIYIYTYIYIYVYCPSDMCVLFVFCSTRRITYYVLVVCIPRPYLTILKKKSQCRQLVAPLLHQTLPMPLGDAVGIWALRDHVRRHTTAQICIVVATESDHHCKYSFVQTYFWVQELVVCLHVRRFFLLCVLCNMRCAPILRFSEVRLTCVTTTLKLEPNS